MNPVFNICLSIFLFFQFDLPWWALVGFLFACLAGLDNEHKRSEKLEYVYRIIKDKKEAEEREEADRQIKKKLREEREQYELREEQRRIRREATGWESSTKKLLDARRKAAEQGPSNEDGEES